MKERRRLPKLTLEQLEIWFEKARPEPPCEGVSMLNGCNWHGRPTYRRATEDWMISSTSGEESRPWSLSMIISTMRKGMMMVISTIINTVRKAANGADCAGSR